MSKEVEEVTVDANGWVIADKVENIPTRPGLYRIYRGSPGVHVIKLIEPIDPEGLLKAFQRDKITHYKMIPLLETDLPVL